MTETAMVHRAATSLGASSKLVVGRALGTVVLTLHGEIVGSGLPYLATVLDDLIDGQGNLAVVVDLGGLRRLDRSAVEVLATAAHSIGRRGGRLALGRPSADVAEVLDGAGLTGLVVCAVGQPLRSSLYESRDEQCMTRNGGSRSPAGTDRAEIPTPEVTP